MSLMDRVNQHWKALPWIDVPAWDRLYPELRAIATDRRAAEGHPCFGCNEPSREAFAVLDSRWLDLCATCSHKFRAEESYVHWHL